MPNQGILFKGCVTRTVPKDAALYHQQRRLFYTRVLLERRRQQHQVIPIQGRLHQQFDPLPAQGQLAEAAVISMQARMDVFFLRPLPPDEGFFQVVHAVIFTQAKVKRKPFWQQHVRENAARVPCVPSLG